jgi:UDP-glucose:(heptosyl)LPS alpha-1,3-glucosyltransferase
LNAPIVPVRRFIERRILEDRVPLEIHTSSRFVRDDVLAAYDLDPGRIHVVPPGVDLDEFHPPPDRLAARREVELSGPEPLILFCGHSFQLKGLDRAVIAVSKMREPARLVVVGRDDPASYLSLARRIGVEERLHFLGPRTDTWRFFQAADVFLLPTRVDMWGMTVVEAMATAVPPVTTSGAGAADVITNEENGFVLPEPLDVDLLAATLDRLAADPVLRHRIGQAAKRQAESLTWDEHGRQVEAAMQRIAGSRPRHT